MSKYKCTLKHLHINIAAEFEKFKQNMLTTSKLNIFEESYKINFYTQIFEFLTYEKPILDIEFYVVLLKEDENHIIQSLWDYYLKIEDSSVNTWNDIEELIKNYIIRYYYGILAKIQEEIYV